MPTYARDTSVSAEKSRAEIEKILGRYGATDFAYMTRESGRYATIGFRLKARTIRFDLAMPDPAAKEFTRTPGRGWARTAPQAAAAWEQATRQRWRALKLVVQAKLEAVEAGISTIEQEFLAWTMTPTGRTVWEEIGDNLSKALEGGRPVKLLPSGFEEAQR